MWGLPLSSVTVGGEVEEPVRFNQSSPLVRTCHKSFGIWQFNSTYPPETRRLSASRVSGFSFPVLVRLEGFFTNYPEKPTATFPPLDSALPMAKPSVKPPVKPSAKQKRGRLIGSTKRVKEWDIGRWGFSFPVLVSLEGFFTNSESLTNFVSFGRDAHPVSSSNVRVLYLWAARRHGALYL